MTAKGAWVPQSRPDRLTRRWWFILVFVLLNLIPPITTKPLSPEQWANLGEVYEHLLGRALWSSLTSRWWGAFDILPIVLVLLLVFLGRRISRLLSAYAALTYVLFAVLQSISVTDRYGVGIVTCNVLWFLIVAGLWGWEAFAGLNDFAPRPRSLWKYWVVPLALFAFWIPFVYSAKTGGFHFTPLLFMKNHSGLAFCLMTPAYLAMLTLYYPRVNFAVLRVTALTGTIIGFWNMLVCFVFTSNWFTGVVHIPLLVISIYALVLSFVKVRTQEPPELTGKEAAHGQDKETRPV